MIAEFMTGRPNRRLFAFIGLALLALPGSASNRPESRGSEPTAGQTRLAWSIDDEREAFDLAYADDLRQLADRTAAAGLVEPAAATAGWFIDRDPQKLYLFLPEPRDSLEPDEQAADAIKSWYHDFRSLRDGQSERLFELAERSLSRDQGARAYRLLHEVLHENPDHAEARRILGYRLDPEGWTLGRSSFATRIATSRHERFPWRAGEYWRVMTDHFVITTSHGQEEGERLARTLERLYDVWRQVFHEYWSDTETLRRRFASDRRSPSGAFQRKLQVVLFQDHDEYASLLGPLVPGVERTFGYYDPTLQESFFFVQDVAQDTTRYHEATHQLFQQAIEADDDVGDENGAWSLEAIATFMESFHDRQRFVTLGGFDANWLQFARFRCKHQGIYVPLEQLVQVGKRELQTHPNVQLLYSQSSGLAHFLMTGNGGRYRSAFVEYLKELYQTGRHRPDALSHLTGEDLAELDEQYQAFLRVDKTTYERYLSPPERLTSLVLGFSDIDDACLQRLSHADALEWLDVSVTQVTSEGLWHLVGCASLSQLFLGGNQITDEGLEALAAMPCLREVDLAGTPITDDGLRHLVELPKLESLRLSGTRIGDRGLEWAGRIESLRSLDVDSTQVTAAAIEALRARRPELTINGD